MAALQDGSSNTTSFTLEDEGSGNVWLLGWTKAQNPKVNVSVKAPAAPDPSSSSVTSDSLATATASRARPSAQLSGGAKMTTANSFASLVGTLFLLAIWY